MFQYHPDRTRILAEQQKRRERILALKIQRETAGLHPAASKAVSDDIYDEDLDRMVDGELKARLSMLGTVRDLHQEITDTGFNIFDVSKLSPLFEHTDVEDIELAMVEAPFPSLYLHFGNQDFLKLPELGVHIEGAYVGQRELLCSECPDPHPAFEIDLVCSYPDWEGRQSHNLGKLLRGQGMLGRLTLFRNETVAQSFTHSSFGGAPEIVWSKEQMNHAIRLVVNSLLYLGSPSAEIETGYANNPPARLARRALDGNRQAADQLRRDGYSRVKICGKSIAFTPSLPSGEPGTKKTTHWRRGHWHRVVHGVGRSERTFRWFMPVIVNRDLGPVSRGRIYEVEDEPAAGPAP